MTFEQLISEPSHLLLKCISGSGAQQLDSATSDTDIKGIFVLPKKQLYGFTEVPQLSNLLLHASGRTNNEHQRRVAHIEFSNQQLPLPLRWSEVLE